MVVSDGDLEARFGLEAVRRLAGAYESVLLSISDGDLHRLPNRAVRAAIVKAMLSEAEKNGFDAARLASAGSLAVQSRKAG